MNYCLTLSTPDLRTLAMYAHGLPIILGVLISVYALVKSRYSKLSVILFAFTVSFSLWLIASLFSWIPPNDYLVSFFWSWSDYINIVFFALGAYFFAILARDKVGNWEKAGLFLISVPALVLTATGLSITGFNQTVCEATANNLLTNYKLFAEIALVFYMMVSLWLAWRDAEKSKKIKLSVVFGALLLFFAVFSLTEYVATITNVYEINLYGLFVLPLFLVVMTFAITSLGVFQLRFLGTQLLAYILIIMVASQLLFLQNTTDLALNLITLGGAIFISLILLRNTNKEERARIKIQELLKNLSESNDRYFMANEKLKELDRQKTEFVSMATHQLRSPNTAIRGWSSMLLEGSFGQLPEKVRSAVSIIYQSSEKLRLVVEDFLNITRIELGTLEYEMEKVDMASLAEKAITELKLAVAEKGLTLNLQASGGPFWIKADPGKLSQVFSNLIDNASKYTPKGGVVVSVLKNGNMARFQTVDTGVGIPAEVMPKLFQRFMRADADGKLNILGTGQGLYVARQIVEAHGGKIWAESAGAGKGSSFIVELPSFTE